MLINKGIRPKPRRVLLHGVHKVGKSTWASGAPSPLFINLEDGLGDLDCHSTPHLRTFGDVSAALSWLITNDHGYQSVVIDSVDWFEQLIFNSVAAEFESKTFQEIPFGRGNGRVTEAWQWLFSNLDILRQQKNMTVILLCHTRIDEFKDPEGQAYDRYVPDLHKLSFGLVQEWVDEIFFARSRVIKNEIKEEFGSKRTVAMACGDERYVATQWSPTCMAGGRLRGMPPELPLHFQAYQSLWPKVAAPQPVAPQPQVAPVQGGTCIEGLVVNGSSKIQA